MRPVIEVRGLSKRYRIGARRARYGSLRESISAWATAPLRALVERARGADPHIWAIKDVSFDVMPGEAAGIIGRNGAGKSTLLKLLTRITQPTSGEARLFGRVGSLLEVGSGFHPELTGRENVYLNGAILGMKRAEINRKFDVIVEFAELERFIDTPVKHYSSGMYMRLAFSIAAHLDPEILLVDEVLAVGDAAFRTRCIGKMDDVAKHGRTVLFVSHNLGAIRNLCSRCLHLSEGSIAVDGPAELVIRDYVTAGTTERPQWKRASVVEQQLGSFFTEVTILGPEGQPSGCLDCTQPFGIELLTAVPIATGLQEIAVRVSDAEGTPVFTTGNCDERLRLEALQAGLHRFRVRVPGNLLRPGIYSLVVASLVPGQALYDIVEDQVSFRMTEIGSLATAFQDRRLGVIAPLLRWEKRKLS